MKISRASLGLYVILATSLLLMNLSGRALADNTSRLANGVTVFSGEALEGVNLDALKDSLRKTDAIGFVTKLSLKRKLESLVGKFRQFHEGNGNHRIEALQARFAALLNKTLALLRRDDPSLFRQILSAREELWGALSDPSKFESAIGYEKATLVATRGHH
jgi:hypothetical protein